MPGPAGRIPANRAVSLTRPGKPCQGSWLRNNAAMPKKNSKHGRTIQKIRDAVASGKLKEPFMASDLNTLLRISWASVFLAKHRAGNSSDMTELFVRLKPGLYRLKKAR